MVQLQSINEETFVFVASCN